MKRDFLRLTDLTPDELAEVLALTARLKADTRAGRPHPLLAGKTLAMIFLKPSLRTRVSFETGMYQLGGNAIFLSHDIGFGKREPIRDIAQVVSRYNDVIMARVFGHEDVEELAHHATVPVINGLSAASHPCQVAADVFTLYEHFAGRIEGLKVVYAGDGNNVACSWLEAAQLLRLRLTIACPPGYEPPAALVAAARAAGLSEIVVSHDLLQSAAGADVIYTDVWASMGQEDEAERRRTAFAPFRVDAQVLAAAGPKAVFMHDLPAHRGEEVTADVMEGPQSIIYDEAENRLHVQKAILATLLGKAGGGR